MMSSRMLLKPEIDHEFQSLRISALTRALEISHFVHEVTIGPNCAANLTSDANDGEKDEKQIVKDTKPRFKLKRNNYLSGVIETKCGKISIDRILHEGELQRKEAEKLLFNNMLGKMVSKRAEMMTKFWNQQDVEYERRAQERRNREREVLQEWAVGDKLVQLEQQKLDQENRAHSERMKNLLEKQLLSTKLFESLNIHHSQTCTVYQEILHTPCSNKTLSTKVIQKYESNLYNILTSMTSITEKCKNGVISSEDVDAAHHLAMQMSDLKAIISEDISKMLAADELARREAEKPPPEPEATQVAGESKNNDIKNNSIVNARPTKCVESSVNKYCSEESLKIYLESKQYLESYEEAYKPLQQDVSMKKFRFDCQKAVNTPVNAISSVNGTHLRDKYDKLVKLLSGDQVPVGDSYIAASQHPLGKAFCTNLLAKKIVQQGELLVSSNPEAAFPIASIAIALWARFPDFGTLLCAHFHRVCPYTVPMMMPQCEGQTDEDFYKLRGYKYTEDGIVEKQDKFLKRMSGIFRLYAAIWVTRMPRTVNGPHPQGLAYAWRWLAAFMNLAPEADITATLLYDCLTVCGSDFIKYYKLQFIKVLKFLMTVYDSKMKVIDEGGPKTRLDVFIQNISKEGRLLPPTGLLSDKLW